MTVNNKYNPSQLVFFTGKSGLHMCGTVDGIKVTHRIDPLAPNGIDESIQYRLDTSDEWLSESQLFESIDSLMDSRLKQIKRFHETYQKRTTHEPS